MRVSLRVLAIANIIGAALLVSFEAWLFNHDNGWLDVLMLLGAACGVLLVFTTAMLGIIGAAQGRQIGWLIGLIVAGLLTVGSPFIARMVSLQYGTPPNTGPECYAPVVPASCQATSAQLFLQNLPLGVILACPVIVGLVALPFSFRMKTR